VGTGRTRNRDRVSLLTPGDGQPSCPSQITQSIRPVPITARTESSTAAVPAAGRPAESLGDRATYRENLLVRVPRVGTAHRRPVSVLRPSAATTAAACILYPELTLPPVFAGAPALVSPIRLGRRPHPHRGSWLAPRAYLSTRGAHPSRVLRRDPREPLEPADVGVGPVWQRPFASPNRFEIYVPRCIFSMATRPAVPARRPPCVRRPRVDLEADPVRDAAVLGPGTACVCLAA